LKVFTNRVVGAKGITDEDAGRLAGVLELGQQTIDRGPVVHHVDDDAVGER